MSEIEEMAAMAEAQKDARSRRSDVLREAQQSAEQRAQQIREAQQTEKAHRRAVIMCMVHATAAVCAAIIVFYAARCFRTLEWVAPEFARGLCHVANIIAAARIGYLAAILRHI